MEMKLSKNGFYLQLQDDVPLRLCRRDVQCLVYLLMGKSPKQIGRILNISHRTVESYIQQLRERVKCHNRSALIEKILTSQLIYSKAPEAHEQHLIEIQEKVNTMTHTAKQNISLHV